VLLAGAFVQGVASQDLDDWELCPKKPNWAASFEPLWKGGEKAALGRLRAFLQEDLAGYSQYRDIPSRSGTSRLSPYLRVGAISPRQIWHEMKALGSGGVDAQKFIAEIAWREFSYHLLYFSPDLAKKNFNARFDRFRWRVSQDDLKAWQRGRTGYPLVDAGMKELWETGYMHNRVRMVVASFLIKHLLVDWRKGEEWFWDTLVDADPAANAASWQWVAGSGADAAPYFRIFNPVLQSERFDPQGSYIKKWLPELSSLSAKQVHAPWKVSHLELRSAGVMLGSDYPYPIIDHSFARKRALALYKSL
jgi:deoxyribodipyrimidine photo-lyase